MIEMNGRRTHGYLTFNAQLSPKAQVPIQHHKFETTFRQAIDNDIMNAHLAKTAALIDMNTEPVTINSEQALNLIDSDTILVTPYSLLVDTEPDLVSFLMVQDFGLQLSPMHNLAADPNAYLSYILQNLEELVSVEASQWQAVVLINSDSQQIVLAIPSLVKTLQAYRQAQIIHPVGYVEPGLIEDNNSSNPVRNSNISPSLQAQPNNSPLPQRKQAPPLFDDNGNRIKRKYKRKSQLPTISPGLNSDNLKTHNDANPPTNTSLNKKLSDTDAELTQVSIP